MLSIMYDSSLLIDDKRPSIISYLIRVFLVCKSGKYHPLLAGLCWNNILSSLTFLKPCKKGWLLQFSRISSWVRIVFILNWYLYIGVDPGVVIVTGGGVWYIICKIGFWTWSNGGGVLIWTSSSVSTTAATFPLRFWSLDCCLVCFLICSSASFLGNLFFCSSTSASSSSWASFHGVELHGLLPLFPLPQGIRQHLPQAPGCPARRYEKSRRRILWSAR